VRLWVKKIGRQRGHVDFEAHGERRHRVDRRLDDFVQPQLVGPQLLVAERVEAKDGLAVEHRSLRGYGSDADNKRSEREHRASGRNCQ
jgi:hypothetical protein